MLFSCWAPCSPEPCASLPCKVWDTPAVCPWALASLEFWLLVPAPEPAPVPFKFFDRDSSGTIDYLEFQEAIKSLLNIYLSEDLAKKVLCHFDGDGNGEIDYQEFVQLVMKSHQEDKTSLVTDAGLAFKQPGQTTEHERRRLRSTIVQQWKQLLTAFREADVKKTGECRRTASDVISHLSRIWSVVAVTG